MSNSGKFTVFVYVDRACVGDVQGPSCHMSGALSEWVTPC